MMDRLAQAQAAAAALNGGEPVPPPVTLEEAKQHLKREDVDDDDTLIQIYLDAAINHIDGPAGWLGRAVRMQSLVHRQQGFGCGTIRLPYPPLVSVESVEYRDGPDWTPIDSTLWEVDDGVLVPMVGSYWPSVSGAVRISYTAGYETCPPSIKAAILLMTADLYRNRETVSSGGKVRVPMSTTVDNLLNPFKVYG